MQQRSERRQMGNRRMQQRTERRQMKNRRKQHRSKIRRKARKMSVEGQERNEEKGSQKGTRTLKNIQESMCL